VAGRPPTRSIVRSLRRRGTGAVRPALGKFTAGNCVTPHKGFRALPPARYVAQLTYECDRDRKDAKDRLTWRMVVSRVDLKCSSNILLRVLSEADQSLLEPHMEAVELDRGEVLVPVDEPIEFVHFLQNGIASITSRSAESERTEIGIFGRDGMSGTSLLLGDGRSPHETFIQVTPASSLRITSDRFDAAVAESATLRQVMLRYVKTLLIQAGQCAVANARHQIEARLARWLLMCHDRTDGDEIALTHEFMAIMIAAQRSGVTLALHLLEGAGMIRSRRSLVVIRDRGKLEELAGDSYGVAEKEYRRLIGPFGSQR
jgi:CRP-like cAMP-binding protein